MLSIKNATVLRFTMTFSLSLSVSGTTLYGSKSSSFTSQFSSVLFDDSGGLTDGCAVAACFGDGVELFELASGSGDPLVVDRLCGGVSRVACCTLAG